MTQDPKIKKNVLFTRPAHTTISGAHKLLALARQRQKEELALKRAKADLQAKDKILRKAQAKLAKAKLERDKLQLEENASSDDDEDNVLFSALLQQESKTTSDDEDDNLPIVALVGQQKLNVLATVTSGAASIFYPKGEAAIGVEVARDFGEAHGICSGKIVRVDLTTRRPLYHVLHTDGDEEDCDDGELQYAIDLHFAVKAGLTLEVQANAE
jgi:hypothetical protein